MCCHISNKTAYPEPAEIVVEAVVTATVPATEKNNDDDDHSGASSSSSVKIIKDVNDGESYSKSPSGSLAEEEVYDGPSKENDKGDVEITGGFQLYKLTKEDKTRFKDMVSRHASSLTLT